ncbi:MAG: hypothetical protein ACYCYI_03235 [Saccharofermentanales bacterium]
MEKNIKLKMMKDKSVKIYINDDEKCCILGDNRSISADKIYEILAFTFGDKYTIIAENDDNIDKPVLDYFMDLFDKIVEKVNVL